MDAFLSDRAPDAFERALDRLLASPAYGERMARRWLDLARYADSSGYANDRLRSVWPYRDWVIQAFNADMPFDDFTKRQLAGDLLPEATRDDRIASGFHRHTPHQYEGGSDPEQYRVERVKNRVDTTGTVWLGMTIGCAQCHTHKFDPISQHEYYALYAFFNDSDEIKLDLPDLSQQKRLSELDTAIAELATRLEHAEQGVQDAQEEGAVADPQTAQLQATRADLEKQRKQLVDTIPTSLVVRPRDTPRSTFLQVRGNFLTVGAEVAPGTPRCMPPLAAGEGERPDRLDLARWLVSPEHPLTSRVAVNREWQHFFGVGLVKTENDFGFQGAPPSHPALLDWLAVAFVERGYSWKRLHRELVTSQTYRQSSNHRDDVASVDPTNRWLARQTRHRVDGETVRDLALAVSGMLARPVGGPSVFPPIEDNVIGTSSAKHKWPTSKGADRYRRGLYTAVYRANVYPMLSTFDGPDRDNACTRRNRSNTPLQSLTLANSPAMEDLFRGFAERVIRERPDDDDRDRLRFAFQLAMGRHPGPTEASHLEHFLTTNQQRFQDDPQAATVLAGTRYDRDPTAAIRIAPWIACARLIMNLDEFVTRE